MTKFLTEHLRDTGETYMEHQRVAAAIGLKLVGAGAAALVHAVFPFLFVSTAGRCIDSLHDLVHRRRRDAGKTIGAEPTRPA